MILGLGSDLIDIRRVEKTLERFGDRFTERVFTEVERQKSDRRAARAASYAKRFAAKEACAKALGTGVPRQGVHWRDLGVVILWNSESSLPSGLLPTIIDRAIGLPAQRWLDVDTDFGADNLMADGAMPDSDTPAMQQGTSASTSVASPR